MATIRLIPSKYYLSSESYLSVSGASYMYANTDNSANYATVTNTRNNSTTSYYIYIRGFNFNDVPNDAVVSNIAIKLKAYHSNGNTSTIYCYNGTTQVASAGSATALTTSATVKTFTNTTINWATLKSYGDNFGIRINCRRSNKSSAAYIYIYGAEIEVTYTIPTPVSVTGVTLDKSTAEIEEGSTTTLTATVAPINASNKTVIWSTSNSSVATVSDGVVTAVSEGEATITATTQDGSFADTCAVTVTAAVLTTYYPATSMEPGKSYILANGNSGTVYLLTDEAGGSRQLVGVSATITNGLLKLTGAVSSRTLFNCVRYTAGNDNTITVEKNGKYLYCDNSSGLRMNAPSTLDRFWHYKENKFWQFKNTASDGYEDTSSEYKYYLTWNNGNATDNHVTTTSIKDSDIPFIYLFSDAPQAPVLTVGTPSRSIISDESGYDQCTCTFTSNVDLSEWEARATKAGTAPARGVGLLVESGTNLSANVNATIVVDNEELTQGDGEYTVTVYGKSTGGVWSG